MPKVFVLDTNILLDAPNAIFAFEDNEVIISETVLEEIDSFKKSPDDIGINARAFIRILENLRTQGNLLEGIILNATGGKFKIETNHINIPLPENWNLTKADHRILQVCKFYQQKNVDVRLITNDILLRIKSDIINIPAESFKQNQAPRVDLQYTGRLDIYLLDEDFNKFYTNNYLDLANTKLLLYDNNGQVSAYLGPLFAHEFILMRNSLGQTALGKINESCTQICKLKYTNYHPYGIIPKNIFQQYMIEALMSDIPLVIVKGQSGCAKTLLTTACGLDLVMEQHKYRRILACRPTVPIENIGFLPGTELDKINPYFRGLLDNLEILVDSNEKERYKSEDSLKSKIDYILANNYIEFQAVAFLRGRSITNQYVFTDECQQLTPTQMKAIVTRIGEGTKLIICGDPYQIDTPFLNETNNGLSWLSEKMKGSPYCCQITANSNECIRSKLAEDAINRLI